MVLILKAGKLRSMEIVPPIVIDLIDKSRVEINDEEKHIGFENGYIKR